MNSFLEQYCKYKKYHKNIINRIIHIIVLFEIPYTIYLIINRQIILGIFYYITFIHFIAFYIGHKIENNQIEVNTHLINSIKNFDIQSLLFFSLSTPLLRIYDLFILLSTIN